MPVGLQIVWLLVLAIPVAAVSWTVTHEEIFREFREYCEARIAGSRFPLERKFFYVFTCEYCFSHYVTAIFLIITGFHLLYDDWRGYLVAFFALPFLANIYIGLYGKVKLGVKKERAEIKAIENNVGDKVA